MSQLSRARLAICRACPSFDPLLARCGECGCFLQIKARLPQATCPLGKWDVAPAAEET